MAIARNTASDAPLTPLRFLERAAAVHPERIGIVDRDRRLSYAEVGCLATRLARSLQASGIEPGDRVAYLAPNTAELLIAHFGVPLAGGVLVAINTRLSSKEVAYILRHSGARLLFVDASLLAGVDLPGDGDGPEEIVVLEGEGSEGLVAAADFLARGSDDPLPWTVDDEYSTISINYTSGTTGMPKGVMYSHRGAALNAVNEVVHSGFDGASVYLWTLPMFHCNGWCTTWGVTAVAGRHVCLPAVRGDEMWRLIETEEVTHLDGAPKVLATLVEDPAAKPLDRRVVATTAGAPPSPTLIDRLRDLGADVVHVYGLTETYGPYSVCEPQDSWADLGSERLAQLLARQGVGMVLADRLRVVDEGMEDVPADGTTIGEIVMRGNNVMKGYFADEDATTEAFRGGWFHSGDLGVMHPDGYVQLVDRAKDIVISGGENISTIEIENAILGLAHVADVAVIGVPDEKWGERPKAFVVLHEGGEADAEAMIEYVRGEIARYKAPREIEFVDALPRTSTGKVKKNELREREWADRETRIRG
jgi:fatty-acyl-CoA synthase